MLPEPAEADALTGPHIRHLGRLRIGLRQQLHRHPLEGAPSDPRLKAGPILKGCRQDRQLRQRVKRLEGDGGGVPDVLEHGTGVVALIFHPVATAVRPRGSRGIPERGGLVGNPAADIGPGDIIAARGIGGYFAAQFVRDQIVGPRAIKALAVIFCRPRG